MIDIDDRARTDRYECMPCSTPASLRHGRCCLSCPPRSPKRPPGNDRHLLPSARLCNNATVASDRACVVIVYPPTELWARPGRTQPEAERQDPGPGRAAARPVRAGPKTYSYFARSGSGPCHTLGTN